MEEETNREFLLYNTNLYADTINLRLLLDGASIPFRLQDDYSAATLGLESAAIGGVKIFVRKQYLKEACDIMIANGYLKEEDIQKVGYFDSESNNIILEKLYARRKLLVAMWVVLMIAAIVFFYYLTRA